MKHYPAVMTTGPSMGDEAAPSLPTPEPPQHVPPPLPTCANAAKEGAPCGRCHVCMVRLYGPDYWAREPPPFTPPRLDVAPPAPAPRPRKKTRR